MMFRFLRTAAALGLLPVVGLLAQEKEENKPVNQMPEVVVTAEEKGKSLTVPDASTAAQELNRVAGGTNFINADDYKKGRASTLKDALDYAPGVIVQPRFGSEEARLSIRGSGIQRTFHGRGILLLQDGVPVNLADGSFDFQAIEPLAARSLEVWRGGNALQFGSGTLGGAVNSVSPTGHDAARAQARTEYGSFDYLRGQISSGAVAGPFDYYVSLSHFSQEGFRNHSQQNNQRIFSNFGWRINESVENRFYLTYVRTDSELPGALTQGQMETDPTQAQASAVSRDTKRDFPLYRIANKTTVAWDEHQLDATLFGSHKDLDHPLAFAAIDQNSNDTGMSLRYTNTSDAFQRKNRWVSGVNLAWGQIQNAQFAYAGPTGHVRAAQTADDTQTATQAALYFENQHHLHEKVVAVVGSQFDWSTREVEDRFFADAAPSDDSVCKNYGAWNPKMGLLYEAMPDVQIFGNVSRSYEPPSFAELSNTAGGGFNQVDAQTAWTVEAGSRGKVGRVAWEAVFYNSWVKDELLSFAGPAPGSSFTLNAERTLHTGVEAGLIVEMLRDLAETGDRVKLRQVYTWSRFVFDGDPVYGDNTLAGLPEHVFRADLAYEHPCGFYGGPNVEWVISKTPVDHANTLFADPYALLGFRIGYRSPLGFSVFLDARNLADTTYAATTGVIADARAPGANLAQFNPGDGRAFYGGVEYRW
jgi:iron complex outermembrane receptor protein